MKKGLSILIALLMILTTINAPVFAEEVFDWNDLQNAMNNGDGTITLGGNISNVSDEDSLTSALESDGSITLNSNIVLTKPLVIPEGRTITIDLNGFTISHENECTASYQMIENKGTLKIQDTSDSADGRISFEDTSAGDPEFGWGSYTIYNRGTLTVESGTIENLSQQNDGSVKHMYCAIQQYSGSTTVNGGTISTPTYRSVRINGGTLDVNAGVFEGQIWVQPFVEGINVDISGGTFAPRGVDGSSVYVTNDAKEVDFAVTGGTFETKIGCANPEALAGAITGGTFSAAAIAGMNEKLLAEGMEFDENGEVVVAPTEYPVTMNGTGYDSLQAALTAANDLDGEVTITISEEITENVTINEKVGLYLTIDGADNTMNGTIEITGLSDTNDNRRITIKNIKFVTDNKADFISSVNTNHYPRLTVEGCSFTGKGDDASVALRLKSSHSVVIKDCTGTGLHSFLQNTSGWNLTIDNVDVSASKSGLALGTVQGVTVKNCDVNVRSYGIRIDADTYNNNAVVEDCNVKAYIPVVVRKVTTASSLTFNGTNTMTQTNTDGIWCAIGEDEYESGVAAPTTPTDVTVTLNDTGLDASGVVGEAGHTEVATGLSGAGTEEDPYLINNLEELKWFRDNVNTYTQDGSNQYKGKYVKLTADIDLAGENWTPIGTNSTGDHSAFLGTFDGGDKTISNLYVNGDGDHLGFFARVGSYAEGITPTVKNITFNNVDVSTKVTNHWTTGHGDYVGGVIANAGGNSIVENVKVTGDVYVVGCAYVGGIVGHGYPDLKNCHVTANDGSYVNAGYWCAGGIIGYAGEGGTTIVDCSVSGLDIWSAYGAAAAVAGLLNDGNKVENVSASNVDITSDSDYCMGYIAGNGEASTLTNVTATNVTATAKGKPISSTDAVATIGAAPYFSLEEAFTAAEEGDTIVLLKDTAPALTSQRAITKASVIDLGGKTLTLTEDDLYFGTTTFKNGNIVVASSVKPSTAVFWMFANQTLTFDNVKLTATGVTGTYLIGLDGNNADLNLLNGSEIIVNNDAALDLDIICVNASTGNDILIDNSKVSVTNLDGRVFFRGNYTVKGNSDIDLAGITKAGFRIEAGQTLSIEDTSTVDIVGEPRDGGIHLTDLTATYTKADTATVNATVNAPEVVVVAKIGEVGYPTLAEAITAAKAGDTINLIADITENVTISEDLTIDGANGEEKFNYTGSITVDDSITKNVDATIKNINFVNGTTYAVTTSRINSITIENCTVTNQSLLYAKLSTPDIVVKNVNISGGNYVAHIVYGSTAYFENVTATAMTGYGIYTQNHGAKTITLNNCSFDTPKYKSIAVRDDRSKAVDTFIFKGANSMTSMYSGEYAKYLLADDATLKADEGYNVAAESTNSVVKYADGAYKAIKNIAKVGETVYGSLQKAIDAAKDGDVITVEADINLADTELQLLDSSYDTYFLVEGKNITIDLNGKTISGEYTGTNKMLVGVFSTDNNGRLTITGNGTVDVTATNKVYSLIANYEDGCAITIENGTYKLDKAADSLIYSGGKTDGAVTVNGGTFTLGNVGEGENGKPWIFNVLGAGDHHVFITGGTFNADVNRQHWSNEAVVSENCYTVAENGTWTVKEGAVAYVNTGMTTGPYFAPKNIGYATFAEAMNAAVAAKDKEVTLLKDTTLEEMLAIPAGQEIVLNLNGKTITGTDTTAKNFSLIDNRGTLTITGDGKMTLAATIDSDWNRYSAVIANNPGGKLTVESGTLEHLGGTDMAYGIDNLTNGKGTYAETIINGGTIKSTYRGIRQFLNGVEAQNILTVNGGTVEGANKSIWMQDPNTNANTGNLTVGENAKLIGDVYLFVTADSTAWPVEVSIASAALAEGSTVMSANVPAQYIVKETNGTWGVNENPAYGMVAQIGDNYYTTLEDAFEAAKAGDTVTLLANVVGNLDVNKAIVLDGNGKKADKLNVTADGATVKNLTVESNGNAGYINAKDVLIENCNLKGGNGFRYCYTTGTVTFKDSTIVGSTYGIHFDGSAGGKIVIDNCQITGWTSFAGTITNVALKNTTFNEGNYNYIRFYQSATIDGCTFNEKMGVDIASGNDATVAVTNSTVINGTVADLFGKADIAKYEITVDGVKLVVEASIGDVYYATVEEALAAAVAGDTVTIIEKGTYSLATSGKDITIKAAENVEATFDNIGAKNLGGANITFENIIFDYYPNVNYTGLQHSGNLTYNNCTINGQVFLYGTSEKFNNCTFNQESSDAYNVWTYGAKDVEFNECTFNSAGKSVLVYKETSTFSGTVKVNDSDFIASVPVEGKAAIEIDSSLITGSYDIQIDGATTATGFATGSVSGNSLWNDKKNKTNLTVTVDNEKVWPLTYVAKIGDVEYTSLAEAIGAAGETDTITLIADTTENVAIPDNKTVTIDLNDKTLNGAITPSKANINISNGSIKNTDAAFSAIEINEGTLNLTNVNIESARHAVRIDGAVVAVIDGGEYKLTATSGTRHAVNVSGAANVTIKAGTFIGPKGTTMDSGSAVCVQSGATVTINGGNFSGGKNATLGVSGNMTVTGGTYDQDPTAYVADGYIALKDLNGNYVVGTKPTATVNNLGAMEIAAGEYNSLSGGNAEDMPLNFVMQFLADEDAEDMATSPYAEWYADFVITVTGLENGSFTANNCYLAGHYGSFGWVKVPIDGMEITEGTRYPVMLGVDMGQKYDYVCSSVEDFKCAMYLDEAILAANPNLKVNLELAMVDNSQGSDAATTAITNGESYKVVDIQYTAEDFKAKAVSVTDAEGNVEYYDTLAEAIAAVGAGDVVIELLDDVAMDYNARDAYGTAETTSLTINGNDKTMTLNQKDSDWSSIGLANAEATLVLNDMIIEKTGYGDTSGAWNTHTINFTSNVEMTNVTVNNSMSVEDGATLNNVTINEANGYYGLWIKGNGQTVNVNGGAINAINGGRGIKVADQYIDSPAQVTLNVTDTTFNTAKKAAVLVSSTAGAKVTATGANIANVAEDTTNFVWVDEDWAGYYGAVETVGEATKTQENIDSFVASVGDGTSVSAYYKTLAEAIAKAPESATVTLLSDVTVDETIKIEKHVVLNGGDNTITTNNAKKTFEVYSNARIENVKIINNATEGRCVDTRVDGIILKLTNVNLSTTSTANNQPITVGGDDTKANRVVSVILTNTTVEAGVAGYGVIAFIPANISIIDSKINAYGAIYMKEGTAGSTVTLERSTLVGTNNHPAESGMFATVTFEDDDVHFTTDTASKLVAEAPNTALQSVVNFNRNAISTKISAVVETVGNADIINNFKYNADKEVIIGKNSIEAVKAEGYILNDKVLLGKQLDLYVGEDGSVEASAVAEAGNILLVATYEGEKLINAEFVTTVAGADNHNEKLTAATGNTVKAFLWKDFASMTPVCKAVVATIGE